MFYRQKILLALIEMFGGKLSNTDLEKHLFLFCQSAGQNYYDFFPYRYGPFSFMSYEDKRKLIDRNSLKDGDSFELASSGSFFDKLLPEDRKAMRLYVRRFGELRGRELVRKTYLEYPHFAARSEIANDVLNLNEYQVARQTWNEENGAALMSIGYEGRSIDEYIAKLIFNNIKTLVDVRKNPYSHKHGFSQKQLRIYVEKAGVQYVHLQQLGIPSTQRKGLDSPKDYKILFEYYATHILPEQQDTVSKITGWVLDGQRVALTCFEADHIMCHRHKIVEMIAEDARCNFPIVHL